METSDRIPDPNRLRCLMFAYERCVITGTALEIWKASGNAAAIAEAKRDFDAALDYFSEVQRNPATCPTHGLELDSGVCTDCQTEENADDYGDN